MSGLELGGLVGSLLAGRLSDWYISSSPGGAVGKRIQVVILYLFGVAISLLAFRAVPSGEKHLLFCLLLFTSVIFQDWRSFRPSSSS